MENIHCKFIPQEVAAKTVDTKFTETTAVKEQESLSTDYATLLPYEIFDDTEYDPRTSEEWLDMRMYGSMSELELNDEEKPVEDWVDKSAPSHIQFAKIPVPAKALYGSDWKNCLVTAYDPELDVWKVVWRNGSGWELEHVQDDSSDSENEEEEEEPMSRPFTSNTDDGTDLGAKRDMWLHRINILFLAEDPFVYSKRFANAHYNRDKAAIALVYPYQV